MSSLEVVTVASVEQTSVRKSNPTEWIVDLIQLFSLVSYASNREKKQIMDASNNGDEKRSHFYSVSSPSVFCSTSAFTITLQTRLWSDTIDGAPLRRQERTGVHPSRLSMLMTQRCVREFTVYHHDIMLSISSRTSRSVRIPLYCFRDVHSLAFIESIELGHILAQLVFHRWWSRSLCPH